jgi:hypothetical protein
VRPLRKCIRHSGDAKQDTDANSCGNLILSIDAPAIGQPPGTRACDELLKASSEQGIGGRPVRLIRGRKWWGQGKNEGPCSIVGNKGMDEGLFA